jgi:hypothetical protein
MRESYDPSDPYADANYYGADGGFDDEGAPPRKRKGWRGFFQRGE